MSSRVQVRVESGILEGQICENEFDSGKKYCSFQGIPYARPPIGDLRFKAPQPVVPWQGVRKATKDGDQCYAQHMMNKKLRLGSEDCLYLNIYTPKLPTKNSNNVSFDLKPVMLFIYGGGFKFGSNSKIIYGPEFLLREDVILVVINYRTGFLGFLNLEDPSLGVPGNAGFKDMVLALNWVKNNIKNFNGDPNNVTIFGESAGAGCVHLLMLSSLSEGLFHRAIAQSGCAMNLWMPCCRLQPVLAAKLGIDSDEGKKILQTLQSMSVEELHAFQESFPDGTNASKIRLFGYTIENPVGNDQPFLTRDPIELIEKGDYNHVPFMLGFNSGEGMIIRIPTESSIPENCAHIDKYIPHDLNITKGSHLSRIVAEKIMRFYFKDTNLRLDDIDSIYKFFGDNYFIRDIHKAAMRHSKSTIEKCFFYEMVLETSINFHKKNSKIKCREIHPSTAWANY
ncbi:hypothetical protein WA026_007866 [Henosepilachna vigintioctopunctata]|uniref:Carboxylesterase type B domain-containing protein n=1 Tax=Henosepilachna vigintioctopunctata TaxID=420089 RepID=A0AAW1U843_9CUCU